MKKLAILVSGSGSNMQAIIDNCRNNNINGKVEVVISGSDGAYALERAKKADIPTYICAKSSYENAELRDLAVLEILKKYGIDYVITAGYLGIISKCLVDAYPNKIVNIHPSLLPKFGGKGFYGLRVHEACIAAGESVSGATVHFVDYGTDTGRIIRQKSCKVESIDTAESLQKKILDNIEHQLLVEVIKDLCEDKIKL